MMFTPYMLAASRRDEPTSHKLRGLRGQGRVLGVLIVTPAWRQTKLYAAMMSQFTSLFYGDPYHIIVFPGKLSVSLNTLLIPVPCFAERQKMRFLIIDS